MGQFYIWVSSSKQPDIDLALVALKVVYIDYGNSEWVSFDSLCSMTAADRQDPAQAIECFLAGVKPSLVHWSEKACILFASLISDKHLMANVRDNSPSCV